MDVVIRALQNARSSTAIAVKLGKSQFTYNRLLAGAEALGQAYRRRLLPVMNRNYVPRVGVLCDPGSEYVVSMWSAWLQGCMFVPLAPDHPSGLLEYEMQDARMSMVRARSA
jgi:acyl-CoA synthetase (AMP-forming)/AMP-acid ligase II